MYVPWVPEPQNLHKRKLVREKERMKKGGSGQVITNLVLVLISVIMNQFDHLLRDDCNQ